MWNLCSIFSFHKALFNRNIDTNTRMQTMIHIPRRRQSNEEWNRAVAHTYESITSFAIKTHFGSLYRRRDEVSFHLTLTFSCNFYNNILSLQCSICHRLSIYIEKSTYFHFGSFFFSPSLSFYCLFILAVILNDDVGIRHDRVYEWISGIFEEFNVNV